MANSNYKSRFRILKGGKISLVVSALLVGSIINTVEAADISIGDETTAQYINLREDSTITVSGNLNVEGFDFKSINLYSNRYITNINILETGTITTNQTIPGPPGRSSAGIESDELVNSNVSNSGTITVNSVTPYVSANGIYSYYLTNTSITNSGTISVGNLNNNTLEEAIGINSYSGMSNSNITNSGTIDVTTNALVIRANTVGIYSNNLRGTSSILNSGVITASNDDGKAFGIKAMTMHDSSSIINSGSIDIDSNSSNVLSGIYIDFAMFSTSSIVNQGSISVTSTGHANISGMAEWNNMYNSSRIENAAGATISVYSNAGWIEGMDAYSMHDNSSISNAGSITANSNSGDSIGIYSYSMYDNSTITNSGSISVNSNSGGSYGLYIDGMYDNSTIKNSGTITATINDIADKEALSLSIRSSDSTAKVTNTSTGVLNGNLNVKSTLENSGTISLPYNANGVDNAIVTNFTNKSGATLQLGLNTASDGDVTNNYSQLHTTNATFETDSTIDVNVLSVEADQKILVGDTLNDVLVADTALTIDGTLNITDNSALLDFEYVEDGETIDLNIVEGISIAEAIAASGGDSNTQAAGAILGNGNPVFSSVVSSLNRQYSTNKQVFQAVKTTTPIAAVASKRAGNQVSNGIKSIVQTRQNTNTGTNSGDPLLSDKNFWIKPYGSIGTQADKDGMNGFDLTTRGIGFGIDGEYEEGQRVGAALFITRADVDLRGVTQSTNLNVYSALVYGSIPVIDDKTTFQYQLGYAKQNSKSKRTLFTLDEAIAKYTTSTASLDLKLLREYQINDELVLQPMLEASYRYSKTPEYSETGAGVLNLTTNKITSNEITLGIGTLINYKIDEDSSFLGNINIGYDVKQDGQTVTSAYQGSAGSTFDTKGIDNGKVSYNLGLGYKMQDIFGGDLSFMYNYQGQGSSFSNNIFSAKYLVNF